MDQGHFRQRLEQERQRLTDELAAVQRIEADVRADTAAPESGGIGNHLADEGTQTLDVERSFAMEQHLKSLLDEVNHAFHRLDQGKYGLCETCGQPIPPERLEALPHAVQCISCKSAAERAAAR